MSEVPTVDTDAYGPLRRICPACHCPMALHLFEAHPSWEVDGRECYCQEKPETLPSAEAQRDALVAEVATYREALTNLLDWFDLGFGHWEADHPVTGEHLSGDPKIMVVGREQWLKFAPDYRALLRDPSQAVKAYEERHRLPSEEPKP